MATCSSLRERARELGEQYSAHSAQVTRTQRAFISGSQSQPEDGTGAGTREPAAWALHHDTASIFRFLRRAKFAEQHALRNLLASASWRLERAHSLPPPPPRAASPAATSAPTSADDSGAAAAAGGGEQDEDEPLVRFDERLRDKLGRPAGILRLARVRRSPSDDGSLESLKARATHAYELARRWLCDLHDHQHHHHHREDGDGERVLQIVLLVDVQGAGISNLELELLPFLLQLARAHYPGLVGAVFVLNYGWLHSGMWQLARSILPTSALERIAFPSAADLLNFFDRDKLPTTCGGELELEPEGHTTLWRKYADDANDDDGRYSAEPSDDDAAAAHKTVSRVASTDSLADGYHTPMANPGHSRQSSTSVRFGMTALPQHDDDDGDDDNQPPPPRSRSRQGSQQHSRRSSAADLVSLARVPSLAELHNRLDQTRRAIDLDSSSSSSSTFDEPLSPSRDDDDLTLTLSPRVESDGTEDEAKERAARAYALEMSETAYRRQVRTAREAQGRAPSTATSAEPSRAPSRFASPSREPASLPPPPQPSRKGVRFSTEPIVRACATSPRWSLSTHRRASADAVVLSSSAPARASPQQQGTPTTKAARLCAHTHVPRRAEAARAASCARALAQQDHWRLDGAAQG